MYQKAIVNNGVGEPIRLCAYDILVYFRNQIATANFKVAKSACKVESSIVSRMQRDLE